MNFEDSRERVVHSSKLLSCCVTRFTSATTGLLSSSIGFSPLSSALHTAGSIGKRPKCFKLFYSKFLLQLKLETFIIIKQIIKVLMKSAKTKKQSFSQKSATALSEDLKMGDVTEHFGHVNPDIFSITPNTFIFTFAQN